MWQCRSAEDPLGPDAPPRGTLHQYHTASRDQCTTAECMWAMKTCCSHYSYKSCDNIQPLFEKMFPDSQIAKSFSCGEKKCAYVVCHGLAPFFSQELLDEIKKQRAFVLLFDESLNHKTQSKQLDIFIRYFDEQKKEVVTRYFNSAFIGHATVADMVTHFQQIPSNLNLRNMIQLSMDGPNVNWELEQQISADDNDPKLVNIGSCGLHIIHGAFKCGGDAVNWDLYGILSAIYTLFKDTPARREDFETITGTTVYAFKCCPTRWIENAPVARRAIEMLPHLTKYVETVRNDRKYTCPKTKSFEIVRSACQSVYTLPRLYFYISLAEQFVPFLSKYQTDSPMVPFLAHDLEKLLRGLLDRCVKNDVLKTADTATKLMKVDVNDQDMHRNVDTIDVGFSAKKCIKELVAAKKMSSRDELEFYMEARKWLVKTIIKFQQKSPLQYAFTRNLACFQPRLMVNDPDLCKERFNSVLTKLVFCGRIKECQCDKLKRQFAVFLDEIASPHSREFKDFSTPVQRLDSFLERHFLEHSDLNPLREVVRLVVMLSHGQASVERGFSVNKGLVVENMKESSIAAQRVVYDHVHAAGGLLKCPIPKGLLLSVQSSHRRYLQALEDAKKEKAETENARKRRRLNEELTELSQKKRRLEDDIAALVKSADDLSDKAESTGNMTMLTKSNSFRRTAKDKKTALELLIVEMERLRERHT